jgi:hypothetical protein
MVLIILLGLFLYGNVYVRSPHAIEEAVAGANVKSKFEYDGEGVWWG